MALSSEAGKRMLAMLPPYYSSDPAVLTYLQTVGLELDRVAAAVEIVRDGFFPTKADDRYRLLGMWETLVGIPKELPLSLANRRNNVLARIRGRKSGSAEQWKQNLSTAIGSTNWEHTEHFPAAYQLSITVPYNPTGYGAGTIANLARDITPAHLQVIVGYDGFIVDTSVVDVEPIT